MMGYRVRTLAALQGDRSGGVPFIPRLDLWHHAHLHRGTLPPEFRGRTLPEIAESFGVPHYQILPGFNEGFRPEVAYVDRPLGVYRSIQIPWRIEMSPRIRRSIRWEEGGVLCTAYETPWGTLSAACIVNDEMRQAGSGIPAMREWLVKEPADMAVLAKVFGEIHVVGESESYDHLTSEIGARGVPAVFGHLAASPMQAVLRDLMDPSDFYLALHDRPGELNELTLALETFLLQVLEAIRPCASGNVVVWGGNYDSALTPPPFFRDHLLPFLTRACGIIHGFGGRVLSHADGENRLLWNILASAPVDILEAVNTAPMVKDGYRRIRDALRPEQVIFGGIPSNLLLDFCTSANVFERFLEGFSREYRSSDRLILGVSDNVPFDANWSRLCRLREFARQIC